MDVEKIREDFPVLEQKINSKPVIYFDNACVSLKPRQVIDAIVEYYEKYPGCAGRSIHSFGNMVTEKFQGARKNVAKFLGAKKAGEVVFTRNTTESINLVIKSLSMKRGDVVVTTDKEHNSNLLPCQLLARERGVTHRIVFSKEDNTFDLEGFKEVMSKDVKLVSMVHTSNLDGYTIPAKEIIKIAHDHGALVMLDGAQSAPHKEVNVRKLNVDFFAFSGHKALGPSGTGVLYGKYGLLEDLSPFLIGGDTVEETTYDSFKLLGPPEKFEAGLQDYAGIIGLGEAVKYIDKIGKKEIEKHEQELNRFVTAQLENMRGFEIIGPPEPELRGGIISFNIKGMDSHDIALILNDTANVMIRSGQHCVHSWFNAHKISGSARVSLYLYNTKEETRVFIDNLKDIVKLR